MTAFEGGINPCARLPPWNRRAFLPPASELSAPVNTGAGFNEFRNYVIAAGVP